METDNTEGPCTSEACLFPSATGEGTCISPFLAKHGETCPVPAMHYARQSLWEEAVISIKSADTAEKKIIDFELLAFLQDCSFSLELEVSGRFSP